MDFSLERESLKYSEKLKDPRWQRKRLEVMQRDGFTCLCCGDSRSTLNVHHKLYHGDPWEAPLESLETLCETCHAKRSDINKIFMALDSRDAIPLITHFDILLSQGITADFFDIISIDNFLVRHLTETFPGALAFLDQARILMWQIQTTGDDAQELTLGVIPGCLSGEDFIHRLRKIAHESEQQLDEAVRKSRPIP